MTDRSSSPPRGIVVDEFGDRNGTPVLLLHGGGVAGWMWRPLIEQMGAGYRFLVPDLPGHDRSAHADYESHERTIEALVEALQHREDRPVAVVGFSLGAQLAVLLAVRRPDLVSHVGIISAQAEPSRWPNATLALLRTAAPLAKREWFARAQAKELFIPPRHCSPTTSEPLRTFRHGRSWRRWARTYGSPSRRRGLHTKARPSSWWVSGNERSWPARRTTSPVIEPMASLKPSPSVVTEFRSRSHTGWQTDYRPGLPDWVHARARLGVRRRRCRRRRQPR